MKCISCNENDARYINERGELCCGICPIKQGIDSIRITDVPKLLGWTRDIVNTYRAGGYVELDRCDIEEAAELIGVRPRDPDTSLVPWPKHQPARYNNGANVPCDMWTGPCSCGAWHREGK